MAKLLDGKMVSDPILREISKETEKIPAEIPHPKLAIIRSGNKGDDINNEKSLKKAAADRGIETEVFVFPWDIAKDELLSNIRSIGAREDIHGVIPFLPFLLPDYMSWENEIRNSLPQEKDVACISRSTASRLYFADFSGFLPPASQAVIELLQYYEVPLEGRNVTIVDSSLRVGKPLSLLLLQENATVTLCSAKNENLAATTRRADIVIAALNEPRFLTVDYFSEGQVVIDTGVNKTEDGYCGDVDYEAVANVVAALNPLPATAGSVGGVAMALILRSVMSAYKNII